MDCTKISRENILTRVNIIFLIKRKMCITRVEAVGQQSAGGAPAEGPPVWKLCYTFCVGFFYADVPVRSCCVNDAVWSLCYTRYVVSCLILMMLFGHFVTLSMVCLP